MKEYTHLLPLLSATALRNDLFLAYKHIPEITHSEGLSRERVILDDYPDFLCPTKQEGSSERLSVSLLRSRVHTCIQWFRDHTPSIQHKAAGAAADDDMDSLTLNIKEEEDLEAVTVAWADQDARDSHIVNQMKLMGLPLHKILFAYRHSVLARMELPKATSKLFKDFFTGIIQGARSRPLWEKLMQQDEFARACNQLINIREDQVTSPWFFTLSLPHEKFGRLDANEIGCFLRNYTPFSPSDPFRAYDPDKKSPHYINYKLNSRKARINYANQWYELLVPPPPETGKKRLSKKTRKTTILPPTPHTTRRPALRRKKDSSDSDSEHRIRTVVDSDGEEIEDHADLCPSYLFQHNPSSGEALRRWNIIPPITHAISPQDTETLAAKEAAKQPAKPGMVQDMDLDCAPSYAPATSAPLTSHPTAPPQPQPLSQNPPSSSPPQVASPSLGHVLVPETQDGMFQPFPNLPPPSAAYGEGDSFGLNLIANVAHALGAGSHGHGNLQLPPGIGPLASSTSVHRVSSCVPSC